LERTEFELLALKGTHQLLAYADDVKILGGSLHTVKENTEALVVTTKETELEVNVDKTKYMVVSRERNAGRGHSVKIDNSSIERVRVQISGNDDNRSKFYSGRN
jgi:hypothetical protein